MNIRDIVVDNAADAGRRTAFGKNSFLNIGKKGQVVNGTVTNVSDRISINFNGVEVSVSGSAVQNATEGEIRQFKIMDVTKDNIVLKEVGRNDASSSTKAMMATTVSADSYSFSDALAKSRNASEAKHEAGENLSVLTGDDYQNIESEQGALEKYQESTLERAIERTKEKKQWQQERMEAYHESQEQSQENLQRLQMGSLSGADLSVQLEQILQQADIPATDANIAAVKSAWQMAETAVNFSEDARAYIIENEMAPTIENLYHGQFSGSGGVRVEEVDEEVWRELLPKVQELLMEHGWETDAELAHAKWLFANDLPITVQSMEMMQTLDQIQTQATAGQVIEQMLQAMSAGLPPEKASLDEGEFVIAQKVLQDLTEIGDEDVEAAVRISEGDDITLTLLKQAASMRDDQETGQQPSNQQENQNYTEPKDWKELPAEDRDVFMARRQLEEIRLKMTLQAAMRMSGKGIDIEVTPLRQLVDELRAMENTYFQEALAQRTAGSSEIMPEESALLQRTLSKAADISRAPAAILGISVRQQSLLTMNVLHRAAVSATVQMKQYHIDYEAVGTEVRSDLGDSIRKAFDGIPDMLREMGLSDSEANQRAVRILGYNQMEITQESIEQVKQQDAVVQSVIDHLKPSVVLELIHRGENPLEIPLDELDEQLRQINVAQDVSQEEKYSRYLWRLEQDGNISPQERDGYIGIYRLLNQIEKTDGAAVGSVMETGQEMTLANLLSAVRTIRGHGIDARVDDEFGGLTELQYSVRSISEQIESGFQGNGHSQENEESGENRSEQVYYQRLAEQIREMVTPSALQQISDGDMERLLGTPLEQLKEQLQQAEGNPELEKQLYEQLAAELREAAEGKEEAVRYLRSLEIPDTMENIQAAERLLEQDFDVQREVYSRRKNLAEEEREEYEELLTAIPDTLDDPGRLEEAYERMEQLMEKTVESSQEQPSVSYEDLEQLKQIGQNIWLQRQMMSRRSYDIPIPTGDTVTSVNVTLIQGSGEHGRVWVSLPADDAGQEGGFGNITMEWKLAGREVKGLILCDRRDGFERLSAQKETLLHDLQEKGFEVKNLSYGMESRGRLDGAADGDSREADLPQLYQLAKIMVQHAAEIRTMD